MNNNYIKEEGKRTIPIYGTSIYIGEVPLDTIFGKFTVKTYQDIIHKGYIVSLVFGDLKTDSPLYIRMHSSCITSECLRSMDCDCVEQLEGALQMISEKGNGILFYLMQEGRGSGYVAKSRDRMLVQHVQGTEHEITTFEAYHQMGMKKDYRDYRNIRDICYLLGILDKQFVLITNNPDKINGFKEQGMNLSRIENIDITPSPYNIAYLKSKEISGHLLNETKKNRPFIYNIPYDRMEPFQPFALKNLQRFVLVASYYLPIKPIENMLYFNKKEYNDLMQAMSPEDKKQLKEQLRGSRYIVTFPNGDMIKKYGELTIKPWWFKAHVFYDIGLSTDYIVLTHEIDINQKQFNVEPIVRIQSESIFDRFPLREKEYKKRYKKTLTEIILRGKGLIMILYNDGRGTGLGHRILDMEKIQSGISAEHRDFDAVGRLLKVFVGEKPFELYGGYTSYRVLKLSLADNGLNVSTYTLFEKQTVKLIKHEQNKGIQSLRVRINGLKQYIDKINSQMINANFPVYKETDTVYVTGVGTSEAHARFLNYILPRFQFKSIQELAQLSNLKDVHVILFSQGLSPNIGIAVEYCNLEKLTVITTIHEKCQRKDRIETLRRLKDDGAHVVSYEEERPDNTLVRVQGPAAGYLFSLHFRNFLIGSKITYTPTFQRPSKSFVNAFIREKQVLFVVRTQYLSLVGNIAMKFLEGAFSEPAVFCDQISFSHGYFQYALNRKIPIVFVGDVKKTFRDFVEKNCFYEQLQIDGQLTILQLEIYANYLMMEYIEYYRVDQINWEGKEMDKQIYDARKYSEL